jgi:hypothetical protein
MAIKMKVFDEIYFCLRKHARNYVNIFDIARKKFWGEVHFIFKDIDSIVWQNRCNRRYLIMYFGQKVGPDPETNPNRIILTRSRQLLS